MTDSEKKSQGRMVNFDVAQEGQEPNYSPTSRDAREGQSPDRKDVDVRPKVPESPISRQ